MSITRNVSQIQEKRAENFKTAAVVLTGAALLTAVIVIGLTVGVHAGIIPNVSSHLFHTVGYGNTLAFEGLGCGAAISLSPLLAIRSNIDKKRSKSLEEIRNKLLENADGACPDLDTVKMKKFNALSDKALAKIAKLDKEEISKIAKLDKEEISKIAKLDKEEIKKAISLTKSIDELKFLSKCNLDGIKYLLEQGNQHKINILFNSLKNIPSLKDEFDFNKMEKEDEEKIIGTDYKYPGVFMGDYQRNKMPIDFKDCKFDFSKLINGDDKNPQAMVGLFKDPVFEKFDKEVKDNLIYSLLYSMSQYFQSKYLIINNTVNTTIIQQLLTINGNEGKSQSFSIEILDDSNAIITSKLPLRLSVMGTNTTILEMELNITIKLTKKINFNSWKADYTAEYSHTTDKTTTATDLSRDGGELPS